MLTQVDNIGTGAGHGAPGGSKSTNIKGGSSYDNTRLPLETGSGGGNSASGAGGAGGGYLRLLLFKQLKVDGNVLLSINSKNYFAYCHVNNDII